MAHKFSITRYNNFLRTAKQDLGLSQAEAQKLYGVVKERTGYSPSRNDLKDHPIVAKREGDVIKSETKKSERKRHASRLDDWGDMVNQLEEDETEYEEFGGNVETGFKK